MLQISRIDHISMAVANADPYIDLFEQLFGFRTTGDWIEEREGYRGINMSVPGRSDVGWELLEPRHPDSFVQRFLDSPMGPGLHHAAFIVPDVEATVAQLRALSLAPWGAVPTEGEPWREVFIHPRDGHGFLFQFTGPHGYQHEGGGKWQHDAPDAEHTLGVTAVNHLSHAHVDRTLLASWYEGVFGMRGIYAGDGVDGPFLTAVLETPTGQMRWEVLQPNAPTSFVQRFLDERGPAMHHVTFEVGDWQRALDACAYHEVPVFGVRDGITDSAHWHEAFIHPRHTGGVLAQLFWEERPGIWI